MRGDSVSVPLAGLTFMPHTPLDHVKSHASDRVRAHRHDVVHVHAYELHWERMAIENMYAFTSLQTPHPDHLILTAADEDVVL
ncbi:hypothetical protein N7535_005323 [Penicillium sp. DV-2018c]|nr:hypothetical protein N7461_008904 [Penicillium sp. DV-2018c]KAJ5571663.1 hypothetical protein N7535_005323 [Penicillium sp. DV-2018c]